MSRAFLFPNAFFTEWNNPDPLAVQEIIPTFPTANRRETETKGKLK